MVMASCNTTTEQGGRAAGQTGAQTTAAQAVSITDTGIKTGFAGGLVYAVVSHTTVSYGDVTDMTQGDGTLANAQAIRWRILPTVGTCAKNCVV